ncbi:MAG TPA: DASS family sodium-coupled anion symporter [Woeseiaceae bacterium]|nr:DASS family sodium-coupled anion symporter [Woeseiaceae bacterium]
MGTDVAVAGRARYQQVGLLLGPAVAVAMLLAGAPAELTPAAWHTAAVGLLMAIWWATEAVPIAITSFLPIVLFPLFGIASIEDTVVPYSDDVIFLFLGGFVVAFAMQRWDLHKRIALSVLQHAGGNGRSLVGGFMVAAALISMWVMNTSTTMMLLPIGVSVIGVVHGSVAGLDDRARTDFQSALLLGIAYAATIGGMATLVGTAPNAIFAAFMQNNYGTGIAFANWLLLGVPVSALLLPLAWLVLTRVAFRVDFRTSGEGRAELRRLKSEMGTMTTPERRVAVVFVALAALWITRPLLNRLPGLGALEDSMIAMAGAIALFLIPSGAKDDPMLLRWEYAERLPWGVLILFGGGLALAGAVAATGLADWIGTSLQQLGTLPTVLLVVITTTLIIFLTELTSNTATTTTFLPIVGAVAVGAGFDPLLVAVPVTLAASCAFMLPVATPPNAIVFGSGLLTIPRMVRAGFFLNIIGIVIVSAAAVLLAPRVL